MIYGLILADLSPWQQTLLRWLGYDFSSSAASGKPELHWTNFPASWGVFVLIAVIAAVIWGVYWIYRREIETCPRWVKMTLATLRAAVVLLLVCIFLGPALVYLQQRTIQPTVVVLRDASQSMNTADAYDDPAAVKVASAALGKSPEQVQADRPTRVQIVNRVLAAGGGQLLSAIGERGKLQVFDFADQVSKVDLRTGASQTGRRGAADGPSDEAPQPESEESPTSTQPALPPLVAAGRGSDIWSAI